MDLCRSLQAIWRRQKAGSDTPHETKGGVRKSTTSQAATTAMNRRNKFVREFVLRGGPAAATIVAAAEVLSGARVIIRGLLPVLLLLLRARGVRMRESFLGTIMGRRFWAVQCCQPICSQRAIKTTAPSRVRRLCMCTDMV